MRVGSNMKRASAVVSLSNAPLCGSVHDCRCWGVLTFNKLLLADRLTPTESASEFCT